MPDTCSLFPPFGDPWPFCLLLCHWGDTWRWTCELQELAGGAIQGRTGMNVSLSGFMVLSSPDVIRCRVGQKCTGAGHQNYHTQLQMQFHLQQDIQQPKLLLSCFSSVRLCATPQTAAHQAPPSLGLSRQEHWSGSPFPSPMHESEKWKGSRSVMSDS